MPFEALKNFIGGRRRADRRAEKRAFQHDAFMRSYTSLTPPTPVFSEPSATKWPSRYHHKCDVEFCGQANTPRTEPGTYRCELIDCPGNFVVTPEMAAATVLWYRRKATRQQINAMEGKDSDVLWGMGKAALESRSTFMRSQASVRTAATAPTMVYFPHTPQGSRAAQPLPEQNESEGEETETETEGESEMRKKRKQNGPPAFVPNALHPHATSTMRPLRPSLPPPVWDRRLYKGKNINAPSPLSERRVPVAQPAHSERRVAVRNHGQRHPSQPIGPAVNAHWI